MLKILAAALFVAGAAAAPAAAVTMTFDAFASFNGTNGNGGFSYGSTNSTTLVAFTGSSGCTGLIANTTCLNNGFLPGAFKGDGTAYESGSVNVPADRLILHPGPNTDLSNSVYIAFTAPTSGDFVFTSQFTVQDDNPTGVSIFAFVASGGSVILTNLSGTLPGPAVNDTISATLAAGESFGYIISNNGSYNNDSIGVLASVAGPVPEPATWGLMIAGFVMVGAAARRRRVAFAA